MEDLTRFMLLERSVNLTGSVFRGDITGLRTGGDLAVLILVSLTTGTEILVAFTLTSLVLAGWAFGTVDSAFGIVDLELRPVDLADLELRPVDLADLEL